METSLGCYPNLHPEQIRPVGAYIHVPFCRHRCGYCNFTLIADRQDLISEYLQCLELELASTLNWPRSVKTIFIGGGTPTFLPPESLQQLLNLISQWLKLEEDGEFTCEANPLDCSPASLAVLRSAGVNRLSLGGQSFQDRKLKLLERDHCGAELQQFIELSSEFFENVSLDLIFAVPNESQQEWQADLDLALRSPIQHLSTYGLTIERGTQFFNRWRRGELSELDELSQLAMYEYTLDRLHDSGWQHYEVSNFCKSGYQCRHNLSYWNSHCWWAFGPGAASFQAINSQEPQDREPVPHEPTGDSGETQWQLSTNHRSTTQYIKRIRQGLSPIAERETLDRESWIRQRLVFGLRQLAGVSLSELDRDWGQPVRKLFEPYLSRYLDQNWLELNNHRLRLTRSGLVISDSLWPDLLTSTSG